MDEIETLPPGLRQGEEIALATGYFRCGKPPLRPSDRSANEIEGRDIRAHCCKTFGIVAKAATAIENS
jgi:hypothetical protein